MGRGGPLVAQGRAGLEACLQYLMGFDGGQPVEQRLVVLSNLKHGFCASLRLSDPAVAGWRLQTDEVGGVTLQPMADGYRLCASRPGRYTLRLQHDFEAVGPQAALTWPVQTELMAL